MIYWKNNYSLEIKLEEVKLIKRFKKKDIDIIILLYIY